MTEGHRDGSVTAWSDGTPADFDSAARLAARLLSQSRQALFFGMGTDAEGTRAAIELAERVHGVVDHAHSASLFRDLDCARENGAMIVAPAEAYARADLVLLVGEDPTPAWRGLRSRILAQPARAYGADEPRRIVWLAPRGEDRIGESSAVIETVGAGEGATLAARLAALRALVKGRTVSRRSDSDLERLAHALREARFGVAVWSSRHLDPLVIEMLNGLVRDLNEKTRFSALPLPPPDNGAGVMMTCGWMTGFPPRTRLGSDGPQHDPWRFDAERLFAEEEVDCGVWISALGSPLPQWARKSPLSIALCGCDAALAAEPRVRFVVGRPGVDHDAVLYSADAGTLVAAGASAPSSALSVAATLRMIGDFVEAKGEERC